MTCDCQVAVVGAGPAGATAARELALSGHEVLLIDRARFPRPKVCAGALSAGTLDLLPEELGSLIQERLTAFSLLIGEQAVTVDTETPYAYTVDRERFDEWLVRAAVAAGCRFRPDCRVESIEQERSGTIVRCGGRGIRAAAVIRADGASGYSRLYGRRYGFALEVVAERARLGGRLSPGTAAVRLGSVPGGYAWAIPRGERVSLGVAATLSASGHLRSYLSDWLCSMIGSADDIRVVGHQLPTASHRHTCSQGRILVTGDAAGLINPLTGEGIRYAAWSGVVAARTIGLFLAGRGPLSDYEQLLSSQLWPEMMWARRLHRLIHTSPRFSGWLIGRRPRIMTSLIRAVAGQGSYRTVLRAII